MDPKMMKNVYTVIDKGNGKSYWLKLGIGFVNKDGSINLKLDATPTNGSLHVRDWEPPLERRPENSDRFGLDEGGRSRRPLADPPLHHNPLQG